MSNLCKLRLVSAACAATFSLALQGNLGAQTYNAGQEAARRAAEQAAQDRARAAASQLERDRQRQEREQADAQRRQAEQERRQSNTPATSPSQGTAPGRSGNLAPSPGAPAGMFLPTTDYSRWDKGSKYRASIDMNPPAGRGTFGDWQFEVRQGGDGRYLQGRATTTARDPKTATTIDLVLTCNVNQRQLEERDGIPLGPMTLEMDHRLVTQGRLPSGINLNDSKGWVGMGKLEAAWVRGGEVSRLRDTSILQLEHFLQTAITNGGLRVSVIEGGAVGRHGVFEGGQLKATAVVSDAGFDKAYEMLAPCWNTNWWDWPVVARTSTPPPPAPVIAAAPPAPPRPVPPPAPISPPIPEPMTAAAAPGSAAVAGPPPVEGHLRLMSLKTYERNMQVYGMNNAGDVVGAIEQRGFVWRVPGDPEFLAYPEAASTVGAGIDDAGNIVGRYMPRGLNRYFPFLRKRGEAPQRLTLPYDYPTRVDVRAVDSKGAVYGHWDLPDVKSRQFFVFVDGRLRLVSGNVGERVDLYGANSQGVLVGGIAPPPYSNEVGQAFVARNGVITPFTVPGSKRTVAKGINDQGEIVGDYTMASGAEGCFRRDASGQFVTLVVQNCVASSINNSGAVAGVSTVSKPGVPFGFYRQVFLWTP